MKTAGVRSLCSVVALAMVFACARTMELSAQAKAGQATSGGYNLFKEVSDKKNVIVWRNSPADAIPGDVCNILQACGGQTRLIALPVATEKGQQVGRGLFITPARDAKQGDMVILFRQTPTDRYFFLLSSDGSLQRAAYIDLGKPVKQWLAIAASLVRTQFDQEKKIWHDHVLKIGAAPAQESN